MTASRKALRTYAAALVTPALAAAVCALPGCGAIFDPDALTRTFNFNFNEGELGWSADLSDYPASQTDDFDFLAEIRDVPAGIGLNGTAYYVQSTNRSDDLFTYLARKLDTTDGIEPNREYRMTYTIVFASNAPTGCFGVGGAPGEAVYLKAGGAGTEPMTELNDDEDYFGLSVDKGNQSQSGPAGSVVDTIQNGLACETIPDLDNAPYVLLTRVHTHETTVTASPDGDLWLLVGTDSAFEGVTELYYRSISVRLRPLGVEPDDGPAGGS